MNMFMTATAKGNQHYCKFVYHHTLQAEEKKGAGNREYASFGPSLNENETGDNQKSGFPSGAFLARLYVAGIYSVVQHHFGRGSSSKAGKSGKCNPVSACRSQSWLQILTVPSPGPGIPWPSDKLYRISNSALQLSSLFLISSLILLKLPYC